MEKKVKVIIAETVGMNVPILVLACLVPSRLTVLLALVFLAVTAAIMATSWSAWKRYLLVSVGYGALGAAFVSVNTGVGAIWSLGIFSLLVSATVDYIFDTGYFDFVENMTFSYNNGLDGDNFIERRDRSKSCDSGDCSQIPFLSDMVFLSDRPVGLDLFNFPKFGVSEDD